MSATRLGDCNCPELRSAAFVYTLDSEHPCIYDEINTTWDAGSLTMIRDYYLDGALMFTVTTTYVNISTPAAPFYVEGDKIIH